MLVALLQWGDRYGIEGERPMVLEHRGCGGELDDRRRCTACGADVSVTEAVAIRTGARPAPTAHAPASAGLTHGAAHAWRGGHAADRDYRGRP